MYVFTRVCIVIKYVSTRVCIVIMYVYACVYCD